MSAYLSYAKFLEDRINFKKAGKNSGESFNIFDTPSHKFFKIMFYFGSKNDDETNDNFSSGLLAPTWEVANIGSEFTPYYNFNSAWAFLKLNDENERAEKLERFVTLLSNINSYSPWYFTSVSGVDSALERKSIDDEKLDVSEKKKFTITCMPDAFDNRIGTLLELYRDIVWSWTQKKEIVPANLRKFDMAIYIFESPLNFWHDFENDKLTNNTDDLYLPSYKMLEFHDCEFSYNSIKSGWSEVNNETGISPKYSIEISYNDCYEESYNEVLMRKIGDVIATDTYRAITNEDGLNVSKQSFESYAQDYTGIQEPELEYRMNTATNNKENYFKDSNKLYSIGNLSERTAVFNKDTLETIYDWGSSVPESASYQPGFIENAVGQLVGTAKSYVERKLERAILGNLYSYSLTKIGSQIDEALQGNLIKTGQSVKQYIKNAQERAAAKVKTSNNLGNLYKNTIANN